MIAPLSALTPEIAISSLWLRVGAHSRGLPVEEAFVAPAPAPAAPAAPSPATTALLSELADALEYLLPGAEPLPPFIRRALVDLVARARKGAA